MKYYMIAGEASGDLHGSKLIQAIKQKDELAQIQCWGGDLMQAAGGNVVKHYKDLAFMGFVEVIKNLPTILRNIKFCKQNILEFKPDVLVLVDYPGFNLRIAQWAKQQGFKVVYYIAPQVWAWKANRTKMMKQCIDEMLCILPFEQAYFKNTWQWNTHYVGHPLIEITNEFKQQNRVEASSYKKIVAIIPGSRKQEIFKKLPIMLQATQQFNDVDFYVAQAPSIPATLYEPLLKGYDKVKLYHKGTYSLLSTANAAMVTSGTATLETALFKVPQVVCYKANAISYAIGKRLVKIKFIALANLIMNKAIVKELIQDELTPQNLAKELSSLLYNVTVIGNMQKDYDALYNQLALHKKASQQAAEIVINTATKAV